MKKSFFSLLLSLIVCAACTKQDAQLLPRCLNPELQQAFDSVFLDVNGVSVSDLHGLMVVQNGKVIYERYSVDYNASQIHILWSATKTFTALAAGFAVQDGLMSLNTPLIAYLNSNEIPDSIPDQLRRVTIYHLLTMTSGWNPDTISVRIRGGEIFSPIAIAMQHPFRDEPGTRWHYNNMDSYMLGVAISRATGMSLADYLNLKLFTPLGIRAYEYEQDALGNNPAGFGLHMTPESMAKVGLLMLQKGMWNGQQLLPAEWIQDMMSARIMQYPDRVFEHPTDWQSGYGYQTWCCRQGHATRMDGMWGQYVIVCPDKNAVCVMTSFCTSRDVQMESFWQHIYTHL